MVEKMELALIPDSTIQNAVQLRLAYRRRTLDPKYQQEEDYKTAELELTALLNQLVARLDTGNLTKGGQTFHVGCLDAVAQVHSQYVEVELSFLQGFMYSMTDRCRHRFLPVVIP